MDKRDSYLYGLFITDANLYLTSRNRGRISLEVSEKDSDIVIKLFEEIPNSHIRKRTRDTNFKQGYTTFTFVNGHKPFRDYFIECGFPTEDKTNNANTPQVEYDELSFWRGVIDGDGSLGYQKYNSSENEKEIPFVSLVTKSEVLKQAYCNFLQKRYGITKKVSRNKRDDAYNISINCEVAQQLAKDLYLSEERCLCLDRKYNLAKDIQNWVRKHPKKIIHKWTEEEDNYILSHTVKQSAKYIRMSETSIRTRLSKIK